MELNNSATNGSPPIHDDEGVIANIKRAMFRIERAAKNIPAKIVMSPRAEVELINAGFGVDTTITVESTKVVRRFRPNTCAGLPWEVVEHMADEIHVLDKDGNILQRIIL